MDNNPEVNASDIVAWVGLDWASEKHTICLQAADSNQVETSEVPHTPEGLQLWVSQLQARFPKGKVAVALEQSRGAVLYALMAYDFLLLYPIPPASLANYRKALHPSGAKDDPGDARLLLELLRMHRDHFKAWVPDDPQTRSLRLLVEHRRHLVGQRTDLTNHITALLKNYFPQALEWAGSLDTLQACDFLEKWPTLQAVQKATPLRLRKFYQRHGGRGAELIQQRVEQIRQARPLTSDSAIVESMSLMVQSLVPSLRALILAIKQLEQEIQKRFAKHPDHDLFDSFPGAGDALAPRLVAAFGTDRGRFQLAQQVQQVSGIAPVTERSGKSQWVHWRWACPKFVRQTFHEFAAHSIGCCDWAAAVYQLHRSRGKGHHAAVRVVAYKWIRILYRCWQDGTPYNEERYLRALRLHNPALLKLITVAPTNS